MLRGIKGTYVYACDPDLRDYLKQHIPSIKRKPKLKIYTREEINPYEDTVPVYNIKVAAGSFSDNQIAEELGWARLPVPYKANENYFICQVTGESMNKRIPNGSWCIFRIYTGGSREEKIVLAEHYDIYDPDFGAGYTVKMYTSKKVIQDESWEHSEIILKPVTNDSGYEDIVLREGQSEDLKVIGVFEAVIR